MLERPIDPLVVRALTQPKQRVITRFIKAPNLIAIPAGNFGSDSVVEFQQDGWLVSFQADAVDPVSGLEVPLARAALEVKIETLGQQTALTTDGQSADYIPISLVAFGLDRIFPMVREVAINDKLRLSFRNTSNVALLPKAAFGFVAKIDIEQRSLTSGKL